MPSLVETGPVVLKKNFLKNILHIILLFCYYLPLRKGVGLYL